MEENKKIDYKERVLLKLTSSRFWMSFAAFLASISVGIAGLSTGNEVVTGIGLGCGILSAGIFSACKTATGTAQAKAETSHTEVTQYSSHTVEAKSDDALTVATVLAPAPLIAETPVTEDE